jgi:hypothetical protein
MSKKQFKRTLTDAENDRNDAGRSKAARTGNNETVYSSEADLTQWV